MSARKKYALDQSQLYLRASRRRLAHEVFQLELAYVEKLAANGDENFRVFDVVQGDKKRQVEVPKPILERLHRRLFALLARIEKPSYLHSGVKGLSYITNAKVHCGQVPLVKLDLKRFYPSIGSARVYRYFHDTMRCSPDVAGLLTRLTTYGGHLPTGSCVSQLLAYFAARPMFDELHRFATDRGVRFSVYVDDLTFSGEGASPSFLWEVKQVIHSHGFGYHKERCYAANDQKVVTGVMIDGDRVAVLPSREYEMWRQMRALGSGDLEQRRAAINSLIGTVVAAGQIEERLLTRLRRLRLLRSNIERELNSQNASPMSMQPALEGR